MGELYAVEIVYRGIFQKNLAKNISRGIALAAKYDGKMGISFGRYGDSPERNGIPAKNFAIIGTDEETLQEGMAKYEPKEVDVTISVDDTLAKGVESWAWYGLQPINRLLKPGGTLIVTSMLEPENIIEMAHRKETPYKLAVVKAVPSFAGLWVYKDDHTDVRILGAIARVLPDLFSINSVEQAIMEEWNDPLKAISARKAYDRTTTRIVQPTEGNPEKPYEFTFPKWWEMREGVAIPSIPMGEGFSDPATGVVGGYRPDRNPVFKKFSTRTMRPVVDFDTCVKCTLCWLQCPDSCFDVTPDGFYDANMSACCGCGVCEAVCPVEHCITMVNESEFANLDSQWEMWKKDKAAYKTWLQQKIAVVPERSHGFRFRGQYEEQVSTLVAEGLAGTAGSGEEITEQIVSESGEASAGGVE
ncbi:MAG TPA: 4Fe-4S dicluster-binding protein [bacterium]